MNRRDFLRLIGLGPLAPHLDKVLSLLPKRTPVSNKFYYESHEWHEFTCDTTDDVPIGSGIVYRVAE